MQKKMLKKIVWSFFFLLLAFCLWCGVSAWRSYNGVKVNTWHIESAGISDSVRIAVLADLHEGTPDKKQPIAALVAQQKPDIIVLAGDMLNETSQDADNLCTLVAQLAAIAPVYYAWGNHELDYIANDHPTLETELTAAGATVLDLTYQDITIKNENLRIGGMYAYAFALDDTNSCNPKTMNEDVFAFLNDFQQTDNCKIMMAHRPDSFILGEASATWDVDLVISGHNHGGQVVLPWLGGVFGGDQGYFPDYIHGVYQKDKIMLAITSGLGTHSQPLPRFNNPPELMILDLVPAVG